MINLQCLLKITNKPLDELEATDQHQKDTKQSDGDSKMSNFKTKSGKAKNLLGSYDLLEKRMSKSSEKTIDTTTISC
jgi:uncharacterized protein (DUF2344 family)